MIPMPHTAPPYLFLFRSYEPKQTQLSTKNLIFGAYKGTPLAVSRRIAPNDLKFCAEPTFITLRWILDVHVYRMKW